MLRLAPDSHGSSVILASDDEAPGEQLPAVGGPQQVNSGGQGAGIESVAFAMHPGL